MVYSRTEHTPLLNTEPVKEQSSFGAYVKIAGGVAVMALAMFAIVSVQSVAPSNAVLGQESGLGGLAAAEAARRTAAAAAALSAQTGKNAKDAKELAATVYSEAQAEAEKLEKLAIQARKDFELAVGDETDSNDAATAGIQALMDTALAEDAKLTSLTSTYKAIRTTYQNSTEAIVVYTNDLEDAKSKTAAAQANYDDKSKIANTAKETADTLSSAAADLNSASQADSAVGEEAIGEAVGRSDKVAAAANKAKAAEIVAAKAKAAAADALDQLNAAKLFQKTSQETLDAEIARNKILAKQSNQAEQDMIQQSHVTSLSKTAAADAKATSESSYYNSSDARSRMEDAANKADEKAAQAASIAATREAELKAAEVAHQSATDADEIAQSQLALAEATVAVEEKKIAAAKNLASAGPSSVASGPAPGPAAAR